VLRAEGRGGVVDVDDSTTMCASSLRRRPPRGAAAATAAGLLVDAEDGRPWLRLLLRPSLALVERVRLTGPDDDDLAAAEPLMMSDERAATCSLRCSCVVDSPKRGTVRSCSRSPWMGDPGGKKVRPGADVDDDEDETTGGGGG